MSEYNKSFMKQEKNQAEYLAQPSNLESGTFWVQSVWNQILNCAETSTETIFCKI